MLFYQLLLATSAFVSAGCAGFVLAQGPDRRSSQLLSGLLLGGGVWAGCELVAAGAGDAESARLWIRLAAFGWLSIPLIIPTLVLCTLGDAGSETSARWAGRLRAIFAMNVAAVGVALVLVWTGPSVIGEAFRVPWGWSFRPGPGLYVFHSVATAGVVVCCLAIRTLLAGVSVAEAIQRPWLWVAIATPTAAISATDILAPMLSVETPRLGGASFAVTGLIAVWQTIHYGLSVMFLTRFSDEILEVLEDGVALVNIDGTIRRANGGLQRITGHSLSSLVGMPIESLVKSPSDGSTIDDLRRTVVRADGDRIPVLASMQVLRDRQLNSVGVVVVLRDQRELESLRRSAITNARLAAVGELAAGIAHEINNPVAFVGTNLRVLREHWERVTDPGMRLGATELRELVAEGWELIDESLQGVDRTAEIVRGVKRFTHAGTAERHPADLNDLLDEIISMARPQLLSPDVTVERDFGELPLVECSAQELKQVFLNLLINGIQAVGTAGVVRVSTHVDGSLAVVSFADDGCGVPPEIIDRIFDPFFTTKAVGEGTGLGLGIAHQIVTLHAGVITVQSTPGEGTTFRVHIPLAVSSPAEH
jgi:PAS domain S-box-containing protein